MFVNALRRELPATCLFTRPSDDISTNDKELVATVEMAMASAKAVRNNLTFLGACWYDEDRDCYEYYVAYDHLGNIYLYDRFRVKSTWDFEAARILGDNDKTYYHLTKAQQDDVHSRINLQYQYGKDWICQNEGPFIFSGDQEHEFMQEMGQYIDML